MLDGYPRTTTQVEYLDELLANGDQSLVVLQLTADDKELVTRLLGRAKETGRNDDNEAVRSYRRIMGTTLHLLPYSSRFTAR